MTSEKVLEAIARYEIDLQDFAYTKYNRNLKHLQLMIPKVREHLEAERIEKGMRWLGFIQGVLWAEGMYSIDELREHNSP